MTTSLVGMVNPAVYVVPFALLAVVVLAISVLVVVLLRWACRPRRNDHPGQATAARPWEGLDRTIRRPRNTSHDPIDRTV